MSRRVEGVKDPLQVNPECSNAVVEGWPYKGKDFDQIYRVDDDGFLRDDDGELVPWVGPSVIATDVDPEEWGDHYHNPADCPEKDLPTHRPGKLTCDSCTPTVEYEHDREYYRPEPSGTDVDPEEMKERIESAIAALEGSDTTHIF